MMNVWCLGFTSMTRAGKRIHLLELAAVILRLEDDE
jgi:hypothetical protein